MQLGSRRNAAWESTTESVAARRAATGTAIKVSNRPRLRERDQKETRAVRSSRRGMEQRIAH